MLRRLGQGAAVHAVVRQHGKTRDLPAQLPQVFLSQLRLGPQLCRLFVLRAVSLQHSRLPLGRHRHEGPLVGVGGLPQLQVAQPLAVPLPRHVLAGAALRPADGAYPPGHAAPHADLPLDPPFDLRDQVRVLLRPQEIRPGFQPAVAVSRRGHLGALPHHLGPVDAGGLPLRRPLVVKDAALSHEQVPQRVERRLIEPLPVPVHLVVAQPQGEGVHLLRLQGRLGKAVDLRQLRLRRHAGCPCQILLNLHVDLSSPLCH